MSFLLHVRTSWGDFFTGSATSTLSKEYETRQTPSVSGVHVLNCLFKTITSTGVNGGALYCSTSVQYLLVESTSFFSCKTSNSAGAIYFINSNNGQSVLREVCGYDCCTTSSYDGQFVYIDVQSIASSKNYVNYSSVTRCVNENSGAEYTLRHDYGQIYFPSVNISNNKCYSRSGIYCRPSSDSNYVTCLFTHTTFADNNATGYTCLKFDGHPAKYEMKSCNILRNTQVSLGSEGTIYIYVNLFIEDCCILENKATYIFFQSSSYIFTLSNCTVDSTSNNGCITIRNAITKSFIHALNHMSTRNCHSEYDSAGYLTPIIQTPSSSKKQKQCFTFGNNLCQCQLRYLVSLISVSIFNFIHSGSSGDRL
jgi:hypothetical protein